MIRRSILALVLMVCFAVGTPAWCKELTVIPTFFVTDRQLNIDEASTLDFLNEQLPEEEVRYGIKLTIPKDGDLSGIDPNAMSGLGWMNAQDAASLSQLPKDFRDLTLREDEFFQRLHAYIDPMPESRPVVVFAHGCCTGFRDSCSNAANLARYYCCPVVLYGWCAIPPTMTRYRDNEDTESNSEARFDHFMQRMEREFRPGRIIVVAHSMGNRLLYSYLKQRYNRYGSNPNHEQFRAVDFACADVKASDFATNTKRIAYNSQATWVTANDADKALFASWMQSAFYRRLGAPAEVRAKLIHTPTLMVADINPLVGNSHDLPANVLSVLNRANAWTKEPIKIQLRKANKENLMTVTRKQ